MQVLLLSGPTSVPKRSLTFCEAQWSKAGPLQRPMHSNLEHLRTYPLPRVGPGFYFKHCLTTNERAYLMCTTLGSSLNRQRRFRPHTWLYLANLLVS